MIDPNYKEFADRFYNLLKGSPLSNMSLVKEYENATKPKMSRMVALGECILEFLLYEKQSYALFGGNWYILESGNLYQVSERYINELNLAYEEYTNPLRK